LSEKARRRYAAIEAVKLTILDKTYQTGRKVALDFQSNMKIVFDEFLPQWNYTAKPELQVI
jgi:hypothetical protein